MRRRLVLIQFSRALVPLLVMLFHVSEFMTGYWDYSLFGINQLPISGGVNYFFALSGFMLYYIYHTKFNKPNELKGYLLNRFIRVYPLYWIITSVAILIFLLFPHLDEVTYHSILASFLLLPDPRDNVPILNVAWSLVHTIYFYILFSLLFLPKKYISRAILFIFALTSLAFVRGILWSENYFINFLFNEYNLIFLAGLWSAYFILKSPFNTKLGVVIAGIGLIGFPLTWLNYIYPVIDLNFDIGTGVSSILIILGLGSIDMQKSISIPKFLNYIGNASFAIYLSHNLVLYTFTDLFSVLNVFETLGGVLTSILLMAIATTVGCLTYSFIELPLIKGLKRAILVNKNKVEKVSEKGVI
ncbi:acyltransferase family protein [Sporosarcina siberiensis]|uniref:Acyltransferase family protein n=1 Tax=Sporosarcina siberiensis TaxID=1365606 RepID=A0ABW4SEA4_9BACL